MKYQNLALLFGLIVAGACSERPSSPKLGNRLASDQGKGPGGTTPGPGPLPGVEGGGGDSSALLVTSAFPRLSHLQWENSVRDVLLLAEKPGLSANFLADPPGSLFGNDNTLLKVTPNLWSDYQKAAETVAAKLVGDAAQVKKLVPANAPTEARARAKAIIEPIATRAYRRPPSEADMTDLIDLFVKGKELTGNQDATAAGLQIAVASILQSPYFVYRPELGREQSDVTVQLNAYEIASRLSYGLWNTIPDETLLGLAASGELLKIDVQKAQVTRLLKDTRAQSMLSFYFARVLRIESFLTIVEKDKKKFPEWVDGINQTLFQEAELFINDVVNTNAQGLNEILTAPFTFVNSKNAPLYGLTASDEQMRRVELNPAQRAGFLSQIGYLTLNSTPTETDPIHRGVFTSVNLTCADLVPPPGTIPNLPKDTAGKSMRERVEAHTGKGTCGGACHGMRINPAGYAFENFDAAGRWRTTDNNQTIDAAAEFDFGDSTMAFNGPVEFSKGLAGKIEVHKCFAGKALELLYGRVQGKTDGALIQRAAQASLDGASTKDIFLMLLTDAQISQRAVEK